MSAIDWRAMREAANLSIKEWSEGGARSVGDEISIPAEAAIALLDGLERAESGWRETRADAIEMGRIALGGMERREEQIAQLRTELDAMTAHAKYLAEEGAKLAAERDALREDAESWRRWVRWCAGEVPR